MLTITIACKTYISKFLLGTKKKKNKLIGRSAIISATNATITGLCTIHATKSEITLMEEFNSLQDHNTSVSFLFKASTRAIAFWLEIICVFYMTVAIVIFVAFEKGKNHKYMEKTNSFTITIKLNFFFLKFCRNYGW